MWISTPFILLLVHCCVTSAHECNSPLGMQNRQIPDFRIKASSEWNKAHGPANARLGHTAGGGKTGAWSARTNDAGQWLQVDFGQTVKVTSIQMQGRQDADQWVKSYTVSSSQNNGYYEPYRQLGGHIKVFGANRDRNTVVTQGISPPIVTRFIRIHPRTWHGHISLRVEFRGCKSEPRPVVCESALGASSQYSASSEWNGAHGANNARLHHQAGGGKTGAWSSRHNSPDQWLQINFRKVAKVTRVATQGRTDHSQWVTTYRLAYSLDGIFYQHYGKTFVGNSERYHVVSHVLNPPIIARVVRIQPMSWHRHISMRAELYGCTSAYVPHVQCRAAFGLKGPQLSASSQWDANHGPNRAPLNTVLQGSLRGAWSSKHNDPGQWIQADLGKVVKVTGIATRGRADADQWVTTFSLSYSVHGGYFQPYRNKERFQANRDRSTIEAHALVTPIIARYVRVHPRSWHGHISMRLELYGCTKGSSVVPPPVTCESALGAGSQYSASSEWNGAHGANNARLHHQAGGGKTGAWSSRHNSPDQWLQINFRKVAKVTRVATQGRTDRSQWVTTYRLAYSLDGIFYQHYGKTFVGNSERYHVVSHVLNPPIIARVVRIQPMSWHHHISMRAELYGCTSAYVPHVQCRAAFGLKGPRLSASSQWDANHGPNRAPLNTVLQGSLRGAWSSKHNDPGQWIQADLGKVVKVTGIATRGRADADQWVTTFSLSYSVHGGYFQPYRNKELFQANCDRNTIESHQLANPIIARFVRVHPRTWHGHISMRLELYGCTEGFQIPPPSCTARLVTSTLSASSEWDAGHRAANGLLHHQAGSGRTGAWSSRYNNQQQWLLFRFAKMAKVSRVATQGRMDANQWVKSYKLAYSLDGIFFQFYREHGQVRVFSGNGDRHAVVSHHVHRPIIALAIRIHPVTWHGHISMRAAFYGCSSGFTPPPNQCKSPLGMESRKILDNQLTSSTQWDRYHGPERSRLHIHKVGHYRGAWSSRPNNNAQWLQVDLGRKAVVEGISTQGRQDKDQWVRSYRLTYSSDGRNFAVYSAIKVFHANWDRNTVVGNIINPPITARFIRVHPVTWHAHISMRLELYGCKEAQKVDGGWSDWGPWGKCSQDCGYGVKSRRRTCTNPPPQNGGKDCFRSGGLDVEYITCEAPCS